MSVFVPARLAPPALPVKAGPIGPGAGVLQTEFPLLTILGRQTPQGQTPQGQTPQARMRRAWELGISVPWIRAAERAISGACSTLDWHLEDGEDVEIDDEHGDPMAQAARSLMEKPSQFLPGEAGKKLTRRELWALTFRHMGLCGNAFWYLDQQNVFGIPLAIKYLRPDRMTPDEDRSGNLTGWWIDRTQTEPGILVPLTAIMQFVLDPPDAGHFGIGLVESALLKAQNSVSTDTHLQSILANGGKLSGILSPKAGELISNDQYIQLQNDARNVSEQVNAKARLQIMRGPIEFTETEMNLREFPLVTIMNQGRDDLLGLWGVPLSQIASTSGNGLLGGEAKKADRAAFWENANHPRIVSFTETVQFQLLDYYLQAGSVIELEIDEPTFEDDGPKFDLLTKAAATPLRNWERRALIDLEPFGPTVTNPETGLPVDDEVWLPMGQSMAFVAPEKGEAILAPTPVTVVDETGGTQAAAAAGETTQGGTAVTPGKATLRSLHSSLTALRKQMDERDVPKLRTNVARVLEEQRREVAQRAKASAAHLMANPGDTRALWDGPKWNRKMREALAPTLRDMAELVDARIRSSITRPAKAGPVAAVQRTLDRGGTRITGINNRTRDAVLKVVRSTVSRGQAAGNSPAEVGDFLETAILDAGMDGEGGIGLWDENRAETIARTEMTSSYNDATLGSYGDLGVTQVEAIDGDDDEECAERNGQVFSVEEAEDIEDHPNGTLDWLPILPDEEEEAA